MSEQIGFTTEGVLQLRQSIEIVKEAYKKHAASKVMEDENAIFATSIAELKGTTRDLKAARDTVSQYFKNSIDDPQPRTNSNPTSYADLKDISGNFPRTEAQDADVKRTIRNITGNMAVNAANTSARIVSPSGRPADTPEGTWEDQNTLKTPGNTGRYLNDENNRLVKETKEEYKKARRQAEDQFKAEITAEQVAFGTTPGIAPNEFKARYADKDLGGLFQDCIPCQTRFPDPTVPLGQLYGILANDMLGRYKGILDGFRNLLTNTEINSDICNLLNFMNFQCLPDLYGMLSVLTMMSLKIIDASILSPAGALMSLLSPIFSPILSGISGLLDQYIKMILQPIDCVIDSLSDQLGKLDPSNAVRNSANLVVSDATRQKRDAEKKIQSLNRRKDYLREKNAEGGFKNSPTSYEVEFLDSNPSEAFGAFNSTQILTREQELQNIEQEIAKQTEVSRFYSGQIETFAKGQSFNASALQAGSTAVESQLRSARSSFGSGLEQLRNYTVRGRNIVNDWITQVQSELQRLILGRAASANDLVGGAAELQKLARLVGLVQMFIRFMASQAGLAGGRGLCQNGSDDPSSVLGSFIRRNGAADPNTDGDLNGVTSEGGAGGFGADPDVDPIFYRAKGESGNSYVVVAPPGAAVKLVDDEDNESLPFNNLQEAISLNNKGILPDLGDISNKKVFSSNADLGTNVEIIPVELNLCGDSSVASSGTVDKIKDWANNI